MQFDLEIVARANAFCKCLHCTGGVVKNAPVFGLKTGVLAAVHEQWWYTLASASRDVKPAVASGTALQERHCVPQL
ncbi:hypothetical protein KCP69_26930 (plasmid) [Salmonella enterica subsp. enterica]|nr:hypothetical protein KCP69_26930 [Salmonella enterica subsp. enterica]